MHMGSGSSKRWRFSLEPSALGQGVGIVGLRYDSVIVTVTILCRTFGVPPDVPSASILLATSIPDVTMPNREYCGGSATPSAPTMMKNWLPLVLGPELAMASEPILYAPALGSSSANVYPGPPVPVPVGSPPWSTNPGMTRWNTVPS